VDQTGKSKYRAVRRIATGGMAEVILASQRGLAGFERLVVVKRILPHLRDDQEFIKMFLDEARLAALLEHPNIVKTLDIFRDHDTYSVAMEYIAGEDLRYIIGLARKKEITIPVSVACRVVADVASALEYVHQATDVDGKPMNMIHRDVAPSNIVVSYNGVSKLIDFGIAKTDISHIYTRPGTLKGKFAYMAPEQITHEELDQRSDIFPLGVVLFEMLTARRLFKGPSQAAVLKSVMEDPIPLPSKVNRLVPVALDQIVLTALHRTRSKRYQRMEEFQDAIEHVLRTACSSTGPKQVEKWMKATFPERRRHRLAVEREVIESARQPADDGATETTGLVPLFSGLDQSSTASFSTASGVSDSHNISAVSQVAARRPWLLFTIGAVVALILVAAVVLGFLVGRKEPAPRLRPVASQQMPDRTATLVVHALPPGATLFVDGQRQETTIGPEGLMVPVPVGSTVTIRAALRGFDDETQTVTAPTKGTAHIYLQLRRAGRATGEEKATVAQKQEPKPAAGQPSNPRRNARRGRPRRQVTQPEVKTGALLLAYSPAEAVVDLDGHRIAGSSPLRMTGLRAGDHTVTISAQGHATVTHQVHIPAAGKAKLDLRLAPKEPRVATLDIRSVPPGASVTVDGQPKGKAPVLGLQVSGEKSHTVEGRLSGHEPWRTVIAPSPGRNPTVMMQLSPLPRPPTAAAPRPAVVERELRVPRSTIGSKARGGSLFRRCQACHKKVVPKEKTQAQWSRWFAYGRHSKKAPLQKKFNLSELADVKAYLMSRAADVQSATAAGIK